ncbi:hypothetical protein E4195_26805 [Pseudomonas putida]|nr:hypothetical protein C5609_02595 [Pseudomonas putida]TFW32823.1 hypothetical protein E4195_26805 [Pseudomonas putida]
MELPVPASSRVNPLLQGRTVPKSVADRVGAGLPAKRPAQANTVCARKSVYHRHLFAWLARTP